MLPLTVHVTKYRIDSNDCEAVLASGEIVLFDPFVNCAIPLSEEEYASGEGLKTEGKNYLLTRFSVYPAEHVNTEKRYFHYLVVPSEGGIIAL